MNFAIRVHICDQHLEVGLQVAQFASMLVEHDIFILRPTPERVVYVKNVLDMVLLSCSTMNKPRGT